MISKDYAFVLERAKFVEPEIVKILWNVMDDYNYPSGNIEHRIFIMPDAHILDRYIEATFLDGKEILTLEIAGRAVGIMPIGYRELKKQ